MLEVTGTNQLAWMRIIGAFQIRLGLCQTSLYLSRVLLQFSVISDGVWGVLEVKKYISKVKHNLRLLSKLGTTYVYLTTPHHTTQPSSPNQYLWCLVEPPSVADPFDIKSDKIQTNKEPRDEESTSCMYAMRY